MEYSHGASKYALSTSPSILLNCLSSSLQVSFVNLYHFAKLIKTL